MTDIDVHHLKTLSPFDRLLACSRLGYDPARCARQLDNVDFDGSLYPSPVDWQDAFVANQLEPAYHSPDGSRELGPIIRDLEFQRLRRNSSRAEAKDRDLIERAGVGGGNGASNVLSTVLTSILGMRDECARSARRPEVITVLPSCVGHLSQMHFHEQSVRSVEVLGALPGKSLATFDQILAAMNDNTVAVVLSYPNNPMQETYDAADRSEIERIAQLCQERRVFLIVDTVYQDMVYPLDRAFIEPLALVDELHHIVKIYSSSKDSSTFSGHRFGYWIGDPQLEQTYKRVIGFTEDSLSTLPLLMNAFNLYFKMVRLRGDGPAAKDMHVFGHSLFGSRPQFDPVQLHDVIMQRNMFEKHVKRTTTTHAALQSALLTLRQFVETSEVFSSLDNGNAGNLALLHISPDHFDGDSLDFLAFSLQEANCFGMPGDVFGLPLEPGAANIRVTTAHVPTRRLVQDLEVLQSTVRTKGKAHGYQ